MDKLKDFKEKYPDIYQAIFDEGKTAGIAEGSAEGEKAGIEKGKADGRIEGSQAERERIKAVEDQSLPGHEKLIADLKFDGKTTGEQAAVKILQEEKILREKTLKALEADGIKAVAASSADDENITLANMQEGPEKWKAEYEADPELKSEFNSSESYLAYKKAFTEGRIRSLKKA